MIIIEGVQLHLLSATASWRNDSNLAWVCWRAFNTLELSADNTREK